MGKNLSPRLMLLALLWLSISGIILAAPKNPVVYRGNYDSIKETIVKTVQIKMAENQMIGLSLALVDGNRTVWVENFGYADAEHKIPVTGYTIFRVGSISKLFTGTAIMQLVDKKKIEIDRPLQTYIPEFSMKTRYPEAGPITIRSIMTHHSGIPGDWFADDAGPNPPYFASLVDTIKDDYTAYPPNYIYAYSNLATSLLGVTVERTSGEKFNDYMDEHILRPLKMNHSTFEMRDDLKSFLSKGYNNGELANEDNRRDIPAGGLYSSVNDLGNFMKMIFAGGKYKEKEILKPTTLKQMLTPQNNNIPLDLDVKIGLNWFLSDPQLDYAGQVAHHAGDLILYHSMLKILPRQQLGVVVLTNSTSVSGNAAGGINEIATEVLKLALEVKTGITEPSPQNDSPVPVQSFSKEQCRQLAGDYAGGSGLVSITQSDNNLEMMLNGTTFRMVPYKNGWFSIQNQVSRSSPLLKENEPALSFMTQVINGCKLLIAKFNGGREIFGEAVKTAPIPEVWLNRLGKYQTIGETENSSTHYAELKIERGFLICITQDNTTGALNSSVVTPLNENELLSRGLGRNLHETLRVIRRNGAEELFYSGYHFVKVN